MAEKCIGDFSVPFKVATLFMLLLSSGVESETEPVYNIDFDISEGVGRNFDGIGGLSGGGATSKLLANYPEEQRSQIFDFLFKPNFGASLQVLKVEIGGDVQSTDGTEASHMRYDWEQNYQRGYQWMIMKEAKKRNPDIKLYALPWGFPGWIGQGTGSPYTQVFMTADYIVRWVNGAKVHHNLTIDYVGLWNERPFTTSYIRTLRKVLDRWYYGNVGIIAADGVGGSRWEPITRYIEKDWRLRDMVYAIGAHYPGTTSPKNAKATSKRLWASEDYCQVATNTGASCWARVVNQNYVRGYMTSTIAWNLIASYYTHLPGANMGLMKAEEPLSGHYEVSPPIWASAHTTQFTSKGWWYLQHGRGVGILPRNGSYVSLLSPDRKDFTIIIETMSHKHTKCIHDHLPDFEVFPQTVNLTLSGELAKIKQLNFWYTELKFDETNSTYFQKRDPLKLVNGWVVLELGLNEIITLTTLSTGSKGEADPSPPPSQPFRLPYNDSFDYGYNVSQEPYMLTPQLGAFDVVRDAQNSSNYVIRQMVISMPIPWCSKAEKIQKAFAIVGNNSWTDISISVDFRRTFNNISSGIFLVIRASHGGCSLVQEGQGVFVFVLPSKYILSTDILRKNIVREGPISLGSGWQNVLLSVKGSEAVFKLDGRTVFQTEVPSTITNGWAGLGTDKLELIEFDNLLLEHS